MLAQHGAVSNLLFTLCQQGKLRTIDDDIVRLLHSRLRLLAPPLVDRCKRDTLSLPVSLALHGRPAR